tara:strand:+ start:887 stop:1504 length:618 start_codon:yes stop_codon:yes gene_type:complete
MNKMGRWNLMKMCETLEMKCFKKGEEIHFNWEDKDIVYFLKTGAVKIVSSPNNHTKNIIKRGHIFGELALLDDEINNHNTDKAIALKDISVCFIEADQMRVLMEKHSSLKNNILKLNGFKIKKLERKLEDLLYKDSKTRIKEYIFDYISEFGIKKEDGVEAENILSHTDIANLTNTSRQTVNNVMSQLRKDNIIDYNSEKISIIQ